MWLQMLVGEVDREVRVVVRLRVAKSAGAGWVWDAMWEEGWELTT